MRDELKETHGFSSAPPLTFNVYGNERRALSRTQMMEHAASRDRQHVVDLAHDIDRAPGEQRGDAGLRARLGGRRGGHQRGQPGRAGRQAALRLRAPRLHFSRQPARVRGLRVCTPDMEAAAAFRTWLFAMAACRTFTGPSRIWLPGPPVRTWRPACGPEQVSPSQDAMTPGSPLGVCSTPPDGATLQPPAQTQARQQQRHTASPLRPGRRQAWASRPRLAHWRVAEPDKAAAITTWHRV
jgi:hypothetical protein